MLFGKRKQVVKRILIVEDEPLTAFDNENILGDAGYEIVATVDDLDEALDVLDREEVHLILSDVRLTKQQTGIELARAAKSEGRADAVRDRPCLSWRLGNRRRLPAQALYANGNCAKAIEVRRPALAG